MSNSPLRLLPWLLAVLATASACTPTNKDAKVRVVYEQVANVTTWCPTDFCGSTSSLTGGLLIMYRINKIENTSSGANTFKFDASKVNISTDQGLGESRASVESQMSSAILSSKTVEAGKTVSNIPGLGCIVMEAFVNDLPAYAAGKKADLIYDITPDQPVTMERNPANNTVVMAADVSPGQLSQMCIDNVLNP